MVRRPALYSLVALVVVAGLAVFYSGLQPSYRLADQVPDKQQAVAASGRLDAEISGSNPVEVEITFPPGIGLYTPQTFATIADVHRVLESQPGSRQRMVAGIVAALAGRADGADEHRRAAAICR